MLERLASIEQKYEELTEQLSDSTLLVRQQC